MSDYLNKSNYDEEYISLYNESIDELYKVLSEGNLLESINDENNIFVFLNEVHSVKQAAAVVSHKSKQLDNKVDKGWENIITAIKKFTVGDTREEIVTNRIKMSKLIKKLLIGGGITWINPVIGAITAISYLLIKQKMTKREKLRLLKELDSELKIVDEKIADANAEGNKKAKYSLMRLRNKMDRDAQRIKYSVTI